jgi:hypothetical protein
VCIAQRRFWSLVAACVVSASPAHAAQVVIHGPSGSGAFGQSVVVLPNRNIVVTDPSYDAFDTEPVPDVGAVYLYRPNGTLISTLRGSRPNDRIGSGGVVVLANGNFVVVSTLWDDGDATNVGAVTFMPAASGIEGVVSPENSLVGSSAADVVGSGGVTALANGHYVVASPDWDHGAVVDAGAATYGSGLTGISGAVTADNSLVGSSPEDRVGSTGVVALTSGAYVVRSSQWDDGARINVGAATFGPGEGGVSGAVSAANSLVGGSSEDRVGGAGVTALANGGYVVGSPRWDFGTAVDLGAATFGAAQSGVSGVVSPENSLVGATAFDGIGARVVALTNGNYVVASTGWDNGPHADAGAVTFGSGVAGISGPVSATNSLVGSTTNDLVGHDITPLTNGNYVVASSRWDRGAQVDVGAMTFGSGTAGVRGVISPVNSMIGRTADDRVGWAPAFALTNGNYVFVSPFWDDGANIDAGAATFGSGTTGISGEISVANSLIGGQSGARVGLSGATPLANGNYVVRSGSWDAGAITDVGAATFGSGVDGIVGIVSPANSLVGSTAGDAVGAVVPLTNGNYVVVAPRWDNGGVVDAGAVTFASGTVGVVGAIDPTNSLVGSSPNDRVGDNGVRALAQGNYLVGSIWWDRGGIGNAGAVTFGSGTTGVRGPVSPANSLVGASTNDQLGGALAIALAPPNGNYVMLDPLWNSPSDADVGAVTLGLVDGSVVGEITATHSVIGSVPNSWQSIRFAYDDVRNQLVVGDPASNRVVLHRTGLATSISIIGDTPDPSAVGDPVVFTAIVSAAPDAPNDGRVRFNASTGEHCEDTSPTQTSVITTEFSCTLTFPAAGVSTITAEYLGSTAHAYSGSGAELHTTIVNLVFADDFEVP